MRRAEGSLWPRLEFRHGILGYSLQGQQKFGQRNAQPASRALPNQQRAEWGTATAGSGSSSEGLTAKPTGSSQAVATEIIAHLQERP